MACLLLTNIFFFSDDLEVPPTPIPISYKIVAVNSSGQLLVTDFMMSLSSRSRFKASPSGALLSVSPKSNSIPLKHTCKTWNPVTYYKCLYKDGLGSLFYLYFTVISSVRAYTTVGLGSTEKRGTWPNS